MEWFNGGRAYHILNVLLVLVEFRQIMSTFPILIAIELKVISE